MADPDVSAKSNLPTALALATHLAQVGIGASGRIARSFAFVTISTVYLNRVLGFNLPMGACHPA